MYFRARTNIVTHGKVTGGTEEGLGGGEVQGPVAGQAEGGGGGVGAHHCRGLPQDYLTG